MRVLLVVAAACGSDPVHHLADSGIDARADGSPDAIECVTTFDDGSGPVAIVVAGELTPPAAGTLSLCAGTYHAHVTAAHDLTIAGADPANTVIDGSGTGTPLIATGGVTVDAH